MPVWTTACPDWRERITHRRSLIPFDPLFPDVADAKMALFTSLRLMDVTGQPTIGQACDQWLLDYAAALFGAYDPELGEQMIKETLLLVSKKNTKSTIAAGLMLTELALGWRHEDENLILAPTKEVADNSFKPAAAMIRADEDLSALLHIQDHIKLITNRSTKATLKVVAADSATVSGKKASRVLVDELWLFGKVATADSMFQEATGGQASRPEGYTIYLTTQSDQPPQGVFKTKLTEYRQIRDGKVIAPTKLPVLYEFPPEMIAANEHIDPANFYVTNPNLGRSVSQTWLQTKFDEAMRAEMSERQVFFAKHLNVEMGVGLLHDAWAGATYWAAAAAPAEIWNGTLEHFLEICEVVVGGIDGGGLDDLLGLCLLGRHKVTKQWLAWCHAWAQPDVWERRKDIVSALEGFIADRDLTKCEDPTDDIRGVADVLQRVLDAGLFPDEYAVGLDPQGVAALIDELSARGFTSDHLKAVAQGFRLNSAVIGSERKLKDKTLLHAGQRLMAWCVGNAKVEQRGNAVLITKQIAGKAKIDPLIALFDAVILMSRNPVANAVDMDAFLAAGAMHA
ncbi:terminase TerL endonuclease subunit [Sphingomonas nostoxanthinifaciens]|uniref:terminase TerL endonuclease subunit n=1 Tax=Sphingomonas nostoxanthinifaciens TaxID=2872652 RepID=UPI001CC1D844|nr:terminase TerL endonuclease subunit [Sphingomonas nostoxanthinifaciens]UAK25856.1 terminase large subunit [Sphingomonas nostoxanthinifaciens]